MLASANTTAQPVTAINDISPVRSALSEKRGACVDVEHRFVEVADGSRVEAVVEELRRDRDLTLVFVRTKRTADRLVKRLGAHGVLVAGTIVQIVVGPEADSLADDVQDLL